MTPQLLESDHANLLFAQQEIAFAQKHSIAPQSGGTSGPLSAAQAQEHLEAAKLVLKVDQDRMQTQQDVINLKTYTVPRLLHALQQP